MFVHMQSKQINEELKLLLVFIIQQDSFHK